MKSSCFHFRGLLKVSISLHRHAFNRLTALESLVKVVAKWQTWNKSILHKTPQTVNVLIAGLQAGRSPAQQGPWETNDISIFTPGDC